jgi:hypothetical protein
MSLHSLVLVVHVTAVLLLCAALSVEVLSLVHLRSASTLAEAHPWIAPVPKLPLFTVASVLVILFSGIYLVIPMSTAGQTWPKVAVATLLFMGRFGAITTRRMRALREAYKVEKPINSELINRLQDPFLKISLAIRIAVFLGIFLLVSAKPGPWESISLVGASGILGLLTSLLPWRRGTSVSPASAEFRD